MDDWVGYIFNVLFFIGMAVQIVINRTRNKPSDADHRFSRKMSPSEMDEQSYRIGFSDARRNAMPRYTTEAYLDGFSDGRKHRC